MGKNIDQIFEAAGYWTLPPGINKLIRKSARCIKEKSWQIGSQSEVAHLAVRNTCLKDRHKGERCFILATGPSVKEQDLSVLQDELCIAVSHFFVHKDIRQIKPRYHVLAPYHPPFSFADIKKVFDGFSEYYPDDMTYLFGHYPYEFSVFNFLRQNPNYSRISPYFIDYTNSTSMDENNFMDPDFWDITKSPFQTRTVIYIAIQAAVYMGCKEIYLLGCDHDYLLDTKRVTNHHFYKEEEGVSDVDHLSAFTSERWFEEYYFRWKQYRLMRIFINTLGGEIFNATKGGMLDVFPREQLNDIFK
jgi:hypothetical protein